MSIKSMLGSPRGAQKRTKVSVLNSTFRRNFALVELAEVRNSGPYFIRHHNNADCNVRYNQAAS